MQHNKKWDIRFLKMAEHISQWSKDPSTKCGALIVAPDRTVVSLGYNGFPRLMKDNEELYLDRDIKYDRVIHCEMNALLSASIPVKGCTLYTWPFLSCPRCAVHIIQAGIVRCVSSLTPKHSLKRWTAPLQQTKEFFREANVSFAIYNIEKNFLDETL